jgi:hypothetical protein
MTRHRLQTAGSGISSFSKFVHFPLMDEADVAGLPTPAGWNPPDTEFRWVHRLKALSEYCGSVRGSFLITKGIDNADVPDKGGNTNLYKALYGSPRWMLAQEGWLLYELFKPGTGTGTEGGPFHLFLMDVFEFATGLDPEEHSKLERWLKHVPKVNRRLQEIRVEEVNLIRMQCAIDSPKEKFALGERQKRHAEVEEKMAALERERYDLWAELYPYSYPSKKTGNKPAGSVEGT